MTHGVARMLAVGLVASVLAPAWAQEAAPDAVDARAQLEARKRDRAAEFDAQEAACAKAFAVTDCVREVNGRRRSVAALLRKEENALNETERRQLERRHLQSLEEKARQRAAQTPTVDADAGTVEDRLRRQQDKLAQHGPQSIPKTPAAPKPQTPIDAQTRQQNALAYADRQKAADARRAARDKRLMEQGKAQADLPTPK